MVSRAFGDDRRGDEGQGMSQNTFDEAKRRHDAAVERFKAAHDEAARKLERATTGEERRAIFSKFVPEESAAADEAQEAIKLQREAIDEAAIDNDVREE
jgi:hypothetical protein